METRPNIPAELRRRVLVEAGHRCAIPVCRHIDVDVHHIEPWADCHAHEYDNLIALCPNCHRRAHRGEIDRKSLRLYKFNLRFAHDKFSQLEMDLLFELNLLPPDSGYPWPPFMRLLIKRITDAGYVQVVTLKGGVYINNMKTDPDFLSLTPEGKAFLEKLGLHEL